MHTHSQPALSRLLKTATTRCRRHPTFIETSTVFHIDSGGIACFLLAVDEILSEKLPRSPSLAPISVSCRTYPPAGNSNRQRAQSNDENAEFQAGGLPSGNQRAAGKEETIIEAALENRQVYGFRNRGTSGRLRQLMKQQKNRAKCAAKFGFKNRGTSCKLAPVLAGKIIRQESLDWLA